MSIIINGTNIPNNGSYIYYDGVDVDKVDVVKNGIKTTVWEKIISIDLLKSYGFTWDDHRNDNYNKRYPSEYYGINTDKMEFMADHLAYNYNDDEAKDYNLLSFPMYAPHDDNYFHIYIVTLVNLTGYSKIYAQGKVWTEDDASGRDEEEYTEVDEAGRPMDDVYDAEARIQIDVLQPQSHTSITGNESIVATARSAPYPGTGNNWKSFNREATLDVSSLNGNYLVCVGMASHHSQANTGNTRNWANCILNKAEITRS